MLLFSTSGMIRTANNDNNDALARPAGKAVWITSLLIENPWTDDDDDK